MSEAELDGIDRVMAAEAAEAAGRMTCHVAQRQLTALLDGELPAADDAAVREHVAGCEACAKALATEKHVRDLANAWQVEGADVWDAVRRRIAGEGPTLEEGARAAGATHALERTRSAQGGDIGRILQDLGYATERDVVESKAQAEGLPFIDLTKHKPEPSALNVVPEHVVRKHNALPVKKDGQNLWVAMVDPRNIVAVDDIRMVSRCNVRPLQADPAELEKAVAEAYGGQDRMPPPTRTAVGAASEGGGEPNDRLQAVLEELQALRREVAELRMAVRERR